ncbi:MAG: acyl-ACP--UDP-N-acetylglucosamine O-acyltransferase, partial [Planctomycetota bacterium]
MPHIHPSAVLTGDIELAPDCVIGPNCTLAGRIRLGAGTVLISSVHLHGPLTMGERNVCYPGCCIGFAPQDLGFDASKDGAGVAIGDGNVFREQVSIHRATREDRPTRVGDGNYFMACSHAGHDVQVANRCVFANNTLFAGHAEVGDRVVTGGGAGIHQFVRIGRGAMLGGLCGVTKDVCPFFTLTATNYIGGYNRIGMKRGGFAPADIDAVREMYGLLVRDRRPYSQRIAAVERLPAHPMVDEFLAFIRASKRGLTGRHGRETSARSSAAAAEAE